MCERFLVVQVHEKRVLDRKDMVDPVIQDVVIEQLADLEPDLCILIREKWSNPGLGGSEGLSAQTFLLALIKQDMVAHHDLCPVRNQQLRCRHALRRDVLNLLHHERNIERNTISKHIGDLRMANPARKCMKSKLSILVHNRVTGVRAALIADNDIRLVREDIDNLALPLVAPVCADNCLYHNLSSCDGSPVHDAGKRCVCMSAAKLHSRLRLIPRCPPARPRCLHISEVSAVQCL